VPVMILMESEPPNETHWLNEITDPTKDNYDPDVEKWEVSTYENWDNLPPAYRGSLESMPEQARRKYIFGKTGFSVEGKPFYSGFNENIHVGDFDWNPHKELILGWDFGFHFPACYDKNTKILTRAGWKYFKELKKKKRSQLLTLKIKNWNIKKFRQK
jgi:hypothetical protein